MKPVESIFFTLENEWKYDFAHLGQKTVWHALVFLPQIWHLIVKIKVIETRINLFQFMKFLEGKTTYLNYKFKRQQYVLIVLILDFKMWVKFTIDLSFKAPKKPMNV